MRQVIFILATLWAMPLFAEQGSFTSATEPMTLPPRFQKNPADRPNFAYSDYAPTSFRAMGAMGSKGTAGLSIFNAKRRTVLTLPGFPTPSLTEYENMALQSYGTVNPAIKAFLPLYGHKLALDVSGAKFLLVFQSQVVPYIPKEVKPGEDIVLYVMHATYNDFSGIHLLLVTDFYVPK